MTEVNAIMNQQNSNRLQTYSAMIEEIIRSFGIDPVTCREQKPGQWTLYRGSARVFVDLYTAEGSDYICVASPVMEMPSKALLPFYRKLLELNHEMYAASFSVKENCVWLRIVREVEGLDQNEATAMLNRVGAYADQFDDLLTGEFKKE
jgi:hypothetical protein